MPYKDEKGHFTNKENAGGPCHHEDGSSTSENKQKYTPQSKTEIAVEEYMNKHWDTMDKNKSVGELAYKISAMVGKPYPQVLDAVTKSIAARQDNPGFDDDYEEEFGEYTGREPGGVKGDLERAGFENIKVVDDKTLKFEGPDTKEWTIKENENAGFDVYDGTGKKVIDDFNATRGNIATAMLQREQNPMKDFDMDDFEPAEDNSSYESYKNHMSDYRELSPSLAADFEEDISSDRDLSDKQKEELLNQLHQIPTKPDGESIRREQENPYAEQRKQMDEAANDFNARMEKYNRMVGLESQMHSKIDNAKKNGQSPQQVLDSVAYDMDLQPGTEEYDRLKNLVMYDTRLNKDTGSYEYNKYNSGSNKQVTGDERKKLQDLSDAFNKAGLENELQDTWEDYGARMGMTNLIHNNVQVLNPRDWIDYMNGNASAEDIIQRIKDSPYKSVFKWKEPVTQTAKETWPPQNLKQYVKKTDNGYSFDMNMLNDKSLDEIMMLSEHPDFKENTVIHNAVMKAIYKKLREQYEGK